MTPRACCDKKVTPPLAGLSVGALLGMGYPFGELKAGEALPSLRKLAKELRISVLTVTRAYNELADEGVVQNIQGKGTFVMDKGNELMQRQLKTQIRESLAEASRGAKAAGIPLDALDRMLEEEYRKK